MTDDFLYRQIPVLGKRIHRYGLSTSTGLDEAGVREGLERGANYIFWSPGKKFLKTVIKDVVMPRREQYVLCTGPIIGYFAGSVRRAAEKALRASGSDYIDVLQVFWVNRMSVLSQSVLDEMVKLRDEGKVRAIGISTHDRKLAGRLAEDSPLSMFMIRYNAAHPGAEVDIFPHLERRKPMVVAYTATCWRKLLRAPKGWTGKVATPGDCYRFCLSSPHVDVVLSAPKTAAQLRENLAELEKGPLSNEEMTWMRDFGRAVHG
jgi:aryl-alcohol dehydrogenase-like predicted oxidoreductase